MSEEKDKLIYSLGSTPEEYEVQKSNPLQCLWQSEITLQQFKILDTYLARIDSHNPERRVVTFEVGELEALFEVDRIRVDQLKKRLKSLMKNVIEIPDAEVPGGINYVTLFEEAVAIPQENGLWRLNLECTQKAMKYFFNVENIGYFRYKLRCVTKLKSRHAYVLFNYLEQNRNQRVFEIELSKLKEMLKCQDNSTYDEYKHFNNLVLKKIHAEINNNTECQFDYEPIRQGRRTNKIRFTVYTLEELAEEAAKDAIDPNQMTISMYEYENNLLQNRELWEDALTTYGFEFTDKEIAELRSHLVCVLPHHLGNNPTLYNEDMKWYHYMTKLCYKVTRQGAKNPFKYMLKCLENDSKK